MQFLRLTYRSEIERATISLVGHADLAVSLELRGSGPSLTVGGGINNNYLGVHQFHAIFKIWILMWGILISLTFVVLQELWAKQNYENLRGYLALTLMDLLCWGMTWCFMSKLFAKLNFLFLELIGGVQVINSDPIAIFRNRTNQQ